MSHRFRPAPAEFDGSLSLLPSPLRERVAALRPLVCGPRLDPDVAESVALAFHAAYAGDEAAAATMVERAEARAEALRTARSPKPSTILIRGLRGRLPAAGARGPLLAATDASAKKRGGRRGRDDVLGWAYITTHGRWGCAGRVFEGRLNPHRGGASLSAELRAVHMMLTDLGDVPPMTVLIDSLGAIGFLRRWQAGDVDRMPGNYSLRPRFGSSAASDGKPTLVRLAERVATLPGLTFEHVGGHAGHPLNEAADGLARFARRCMGGEQPGDRDSLDRHASGLAAAFLDSWHARPGPPATGRRNPPGRHP